jgi:hypothetical protein
VEGQEGEAKQYQGQRLGVVRKPTHGSLWEARAKMDGPFLVTKKNKTKLIPTSKHRRPSIVAFLEC